MFYFVNAAAFAFHRLLLNGRFDVHKIDFNFFCLFCVALYLSLASLICDMAVWCGFTAAPRVSHAGQFNKIHLMIRLPI